MYALIRHTGLQRALRAEAVPLLLSFVAAEAFYKFHSFTLETGAFLLTWLAMSWAASAITSRSMRPD